MRLSPCKMPVQSGNEVSVRSIEPFLHHHAFPRTRHDGEFGGARRPNLGDEAMALHAHRPERQAHALDLVPCDAARSAADTPLQRLFAEPELVRRAEQRWPIAVCYFARRNLA